MGRRQCSREPVQSGHPLKQTVPVPRRPPSPHARPITLNVHAFISISFRAAASRPSAAVQSALKAARTFAYSLLSDRMSVVPKIYVNSKSLK